MGDHQTPIILSCSSFLIPGAVLNENKTRIQQIHYFQLHHSTSQKKVVRSIWWETRKTEDSQRQIFGLSATVVEEDDDVSNSSDEGTYPTFSSLTILRLFHPLYSFGPHNTYNRPLQATHPNLSCPPCKSLSHSVCSLIVSSTHPSQLLKHRKHIRDGHFLLYVYSATLFHVDWVTAKTLFRGNWPCREMN